MIRKIVIKKIIWFKIVILLVLIAIECLALFYVFSPASESLFQKLGLVMGCLVIFLIMCGISALPFLILYCLADVKYHLEELREIKQGTSEEVNLGTLFKKYEERESKKCPKCGSPRCDRCGNILW